MIEIEKLSLEQLQSISDNTLLKQYQDAIQEIKTTRLGNKVIEEYYGKSLEYIYQELMEIEEYNTSRIIFPGDIVYFYPNIREQKSRYQRTCDFSGAIIHPGSLYISYRPLLDNISRNEKYVLRRTIRVENGYQYNLPMTLHAFEQFEQDMIIERVSMEIDFNHLNNQMGGALQLTHLSPSRKIKK